LRRGVNAVRVPLGTKVARLLDEYVPGVLVLGRPSTRKHVRIVATIRKQAKVYRIPIRLLSARAIAEAFSGRNDNKHQIASALAAQFPDLLSVLPPKRKPWQSEDYRMASLTQPRCERRPLSESGTQIRFFRKRTEHEPCSKSIQRALSIPLLSIQLLRRPACAAKLF
jgi:hypothetical protein